MPLFPRDPDRGDVPAEAGAGRSPGGRRSGGSRAHAAPGTALESVSELVRFGLNTEVSLGVRVFEPGFSPEVPVELCRKCGFEAWPQVSWTQAPGGPGRCAVHSHESHVAGVLAGAWDPLRVVTYFGSRTPGRELNEESESSSWGQK